MRDDYVRAYSSLRRQHWWWRARDHFVLARLRGRWSAASDLRILEVGCADGHLFRRFEAFGCVEGLEPSTELARAGPHEDRIHLSALGGEFRADQPFDLVLMLDVLEHIEKPVDALRHAHRLLSENGHLVLTVPASPRLWTRHDEINDHFRRYSRSSLRAHLVEAGFSLLTAEYLFQWLYLAKLGVRVLEAVRPASEELPTVPPTWINWLLYGFCLVEQATLTPLGAPFGSTLFAIARVS